MTLTEPNPRHSRGIMKLFWFKTPTTDRGSQPKPNALPPKTPMPCKIFEPNNKIDTMYYTASKQGKKESWLGRLSSTRPPAPEPAGP